jgi:putative oxidoreductase
MKIPECISARELLVTLLRIVLGVVFIFVSIEKIADPTAFAASISGYRLVSADPALFISTVVPWIEFLCGLGLLFGLFVRGSALLALVMLILFTAVVLSALWRGLDISCGCYTQDPTAERIGWWKAGENVVLIGMSYLVLRHASPRFTLERFLQRRSRPMHTGE